MNSPTKNVPAASSQRGQLYRAAIVGAATLKGKEVAEMLGLDYWQTETFLKERGVPLNYSAADLEADTATLAKILAHS